MASVCGSARQPLSASFIEFNTGFFSVLIFEKRMAKIANVICNNANTIFQVMENNNRGESVENATKLMEPRISSNWETMYGLSFIPLLCMTYINSHHLGQLAIPIVVTIVNLYIIICYVFNSNYPSTKFFQRFMYSIKTGLKSTFAKCSTLNGGRCGL